MTRQGEEGKTKAVSIHYLGLEQDLVGVDVAPNQTSLTNITKGSGRDQVP